MRVLILTLGNVLLIGPDDGLSSDSVPQCRSECAAQLWSS
jgi:hypothetical protein